MNRDEAKKMIRETFEHPFDRDRFAHFTRNLFNTLDNATGFKPLAGAYVPEAFRESIRQYERIGKYADLDGRTIDILVVHLKKETTLERARSLQRNFVAHYLNGGRGGELRDAAVVAYVSPDPADWRFSLVKMDYRLARSEVGKTKTEVDLTPARRHSFLVGEQENSHTAQKQLVPLLESERPPRLGDFENAFNIEVVSKEFFEKYRELFHATTDALAAVVKTDAAIRDNFAANKVTVADFAKKLLGQIVFLYFLQKKGWFGVERDAAWGTGPRNFLRQLFEGKHGSYRNFFNDILEPLFYEALAAERTDDFYSRFNCKIPFLNGGLFDPLNGYDWVHTDILLPNDLFSNTMKTTEGDVGCGILDIFDRYNFTVKEDEPLEKEVAVDPEMLGKVFENLLEVRDRKSKGTYYTPREIVHYMCQEGLLGYLTSALEGKVAHEDLKMLIRHGERTLEHDALAVEKKKGDTAYRGKYGRTTMPVAVIEHASAIDGRLADVRVCDPAIGSGAFPVGMMSEIVRARNVLTRFLPASSGRTAEEFKRHAIRNCLYGVDIDPGAVEIAKLRLWLSLVVDEEDRRQIKPLPNLDYKIVRGNSLLGVEKSLFNLDAFKKLEELKPLYFNETNNRRKQAVKKQIDDLILTITKNNATFDFEVYFSEVWGEKGGFDVVIANPPYVSAGKIGKTKPDLKVTYKEFFDGNSDLYTYFIKKGLDITRSAGCLCYITSNKYMRAGYGKKTRELLTSEAMPMLIIDFGELPVFEAATDPSIILVKKSVQSDASLTVITIKTVEEIARIVDVVHAKGFTMPVASLPPGGWILEDRTVLRLKEKLRKQGTPLGEYVKGRFYRGILTGLNEAFIIDEETKNRLIAEDKKGAEIIKPWLDGNEIKRWTSAWSRQFLVKIESSANATWPWSLARKEKEAEGIFRSTYPAIHAHLLEHKEGLKARKDQGCFWWELRSCAYSDAFSKTKILYNETSKELHAFIDRNGFYVNKTGFVMLSEEPEYLLGILNSRLLDWYYRVDFPTYGDPWKGGRIQFRKEPNMIGVPIAQGSPAQKSAIVDHVKKIIAATSKSPSADVSVLEREIDTIVYALYGLTAEEIKIVEYGKEK